MLSTDSAFPSSSCSQLESVRDYAFDELPAAERSPLERHIAVCGDCAAELDRLRLTTAALRTLPDLEVPRRIAFVSDKVFEPSPLWKFWNAGAHWNFASACVLAAALVVSSWHFVSAARPAETRTVVRTAAVSQNQMNQDQINSAVAKAVAQIRREDAQLTKAAIEASEKKHDRDYRNQMVAIEESFMVLQKRLNNSYSRVALSEAASSGAAQ
jgi:hypothetical protein